MWVWLCRLSSGGEGVVVMPVGAAVSAVGPPQQRVVRTPSIASDATVLLCSLVDLALGVVHQRRAPLMGVGYYPLVAGIVVGALEHALSQCQRHFAAETKAF